MTGFRAPTPHGVTRTRSIAFSLIGSSLALFLAKLLFELFPNSPPYRAQCMACNLQKIAFHTQRRQTEISRVMSINQRESTLYSHIKSQNKSLRDTSNSLANPNTSSYEIAHLNIGGPSNRSGGVVRWSKPIEVSSVI